MLLAKEGWLAGPSGVEHFEAVDTSGAAGVPFFFEAAGREQMAQFPDLLPCCPSHELK